MNTLEINRVLKSNKSFLGTFPCDVIKLLPYSIRSKGLIVNTDPKGEKGEHWTAIWFNACGSAEYFDSFGFPPLIDSVREFMEERSAGHFVYNSKTLQHPFATSCGQYCIYFIQSRSADTSYKAFVKKFSTNLTLNEEILRVYFKGAGYKRKTDRKR